MMVLRYLAIGLALALSTGTAIAQTAKPQPARGAPGPTPPRPYDTSKVRPGIPTAPTTPAPRPPNPAPGVYRVQGESGECLRANWQLPEPTPYRMGNCSGADILQVTPTPAAGRFTVEYPGLDKCLTFEGDDNISLRRCDGRSAQLFEFSLVPDGSYRIHTLIRGRFDCLTRSDLYIDQPRGTSALQLATCNERHERQNFRFLPPG